MTLRASVCAKLRRVLRSRKSQFSSQWKLGVTYLQADSFGLQIPPGVGWILETLKVELLKYFTAVFLVKGALCRFGE